ncbi:MAG TPA: ATP-binding cassette domain-containing protein [Candidatus Deferrimicrobiaceae bacterium]
MSELLRAEGIEKSFGATRVLRGVTLAVDQGEVVGLFGPNGAGKTVLTNILSGLFFPDRGRILFDGREITRMPMDARFRAGLARTFQIPGPYPSLSVRESVRVALLAGRQGGDGREAAARIEEELDTVLVRTGLFSQRHWLASKLSQGCLRRLEFARAISCRPRLVLLDEIFSALSVQDVSELAALLRSLHSEEGTSFLLISHNPLFLEQMCDRVVAIEDGRVTWTGDPADLHRYVPSAAGHHHEA